MREHVLALLRRHLPAALRPSGQSNILTKCPFHKGGEERKPSFSVNVDLGVFHCFTCHRTGTMRTLLKLLELPRQQIEAELSIIQPAIQRQAELYKLEKANQFVHADPFMVEYKLPESLLGVYDWCPSLLVESGFDPSILKSMDVGFDRVNQRVTYPIRDMYGNLGGFSGGVTPGTTRYREQKYRVYEGRRRGFDGKMLQSDFGDWFDDKHPDYHFENHDFLWNYDEVFAASIAMSDPKTRVYVVEGFKACLWMLQCGYKNTMALMGSYVSDRQQQMLHRLGCTVVLCLDNDEAGRKATLNVGDLLWRPLYGRLLVMPYPQEDWTEETQPDDYEPWALQEMESLSKPFLEYINSRRRGHLW
jgi:DNA primase